MPEVEVPILFEMETEQYGTIKVQTLRFGGIMKICELYPEMVISSPKEFCSNFLAAVSINEDDDKIGIGRFSDAELDYFARNYLEKDQDLFERKGEPTEILRLEGEGDCEYFTRVAVDYFKEWNERFANSAITKVMKPTAWMKNLTPLVRAANVLPSALQISKNISPFLKLPNTMAVSPVSIKPKSLLEDFDWSTIRNPVHDTNEHIQETNEHLAKAVEQLETLSLQLKASEEANQHLQNLVAQSQGTTGQNQTMIRLNQAVLLVTIIGVVLTYLGYQAGKLASLTSNTTSQKTATNADSKPASPINPPIPSVQTPLPAKSIIPRTEATPKKSNDGKLTSIRTNTGTIADH